MDLTETLTALADILTDMHNRIVSLELKLESLEDQSGSGEWNSDWESEVNSLIEAALNDIDYEDHVRDAFGNMSFSVVVD